MPIKRTYAELGDACATAHAMELVGDRWNYPILRELLLAPKRFGELAPAVRGVTPAVLTERLRTLESAGLVRRGSSSATGRAPVYEATEWAHELDPVFEALGRWAMASPLRDTTDATLTPDATIQSMRTMAERRAVAPSVTLALHLADGRVPGDPGYDYVVRADADGLAADRGAAGDPDVRVTGDAAAWLRVLYESAEPAAAGLDVDGDLAALDRVLALFPAIPAAGPPSPRSA